VYIDLEAGVWCTALGHGHAEVNQAIQAQVDKAMHLGYRYKNPIVEEAAQAVLRLHSMPEGKVAFLSSGSEAVEFGVQAIRRLTGKPLLMAFKGTYLSAFGSAGKREEAEWHNFDFSECAQCAEQCGRACPLVEQIPFDQIGGLVFESGSGQVKTPPAKVVSVLAALIRQRQGLVLANEITTGFGRTGAWFGYEHYELRPDIVAMGKGIGNGYPVSAVAMTNEVGKALEQSGLRYAQSHQNDPLGCAVVLSVIEALDREALVQRSAELGARFKLELESLARRHDAIKEVRGRGLMLGIEFSDTLKQPCLAVLHEELFRRGYLVGYSQPLHFFRFFPPLVVSEEHLQGMIAVLDELLKKLNA
jgi:acetylornithine aminotransferase